MDSRRVGGVESLVPALDRKSERFTGSPRMTLCAMDGAAESPWMGLRRVSRRDLVNLYFDVHKKEESDCFSDKKEKHEI